MSGNPKCGTCCGRGTTTALVCFRNGTSRIIETPCRDCALVPELAKVKVARE